MNSLPLLASSRKHSSRRIAYQVARGIAIKSSVVNSVSQLVAAV